MRVPSYSQQRSERRLDSMTSMIDVVFLLLIFFVCTAAGQIREWLIPTELPAAGSVEAALPVVPEESWSVEVWLTLTRDAAARKTLIEMNGSLFDDPAILIERLNQLAEIGPESPVILDISADVPLEDWLRIYDACQTAGFHSVNLAVDP
jgi:biopolymer transport protein ExbD